MAAQPFTAAAQDAAVGRHSYVRCWLLECSMLLWAMQCRYAAVCKHAAVSNAVQRFDVINVNDTP